MTLTIIFAVLALLGIPFAIWQYRIKDLLSCWRGVFGYSLIVIFGVCSVIAFFSYIPSKKDSEIKYMQLLQEKASIEQMICSGGNVDKLMLNQHVIDYNNRVIETKENSKRFVFKEYYSKDVDWDALEPIEWK